MSEKLKGIEGSAVKLSKKNEIAIARIRAAKKYGYVEPVIGAPELWGLAPNDDIQVVAPPLDLSGHRASLYFDTVKLRLEVCGRPAVRTAWRELRKNSVVTPDEDRWKEFFSLRFYGDYLYVTIHNPTQEKLRAVYSAFDRFGGLKSEPTVLEAHFAIDWQHKLHDRLVYLASVLPLFVKAVGVDLFGGGTPRQFVPNGKIKEATGKEDGYTLHLRTSTRRSESGESKYAGRPKSYQYNEAYNGPLTVYFGRKGTDQIRTYLKDEDCNKAVQESERVVRHERVFKAPSLAAMGVTTLESLLSFDASKLSKSFSYEVAFMERHLVVQGQIERFCKLVKSGVFAVRESEGGVRYKRCRPKKVTLAHIPMNKRVNSACRYFADTWREARSSASATKISEKPRAESRMYPTEIDAHYSY